MPKVELDELVTGAEIGRRLGVSKQRAHQLADRDDFPQPLGRVGNYRVWRWSDVDRWNRTKRSPG
jgi:predicted DNA-binding transcriptional regulator AlpA